MIASIESNTQSQFMDYGEYNNKKSPAGYMQEFVKNPPPILKNFHPEDIKAFLKTGEEKHFLKGKTIMNSFGQEKFGALVVEGNVGMFKDKVQLGVLEKGTFLGETFLFGKNTRTVSVAPVDESTALIFNRQNTLNFFRKKPEKLFNIFTRNIIISQQNKMKVIKNQLYLAKKQLLSNSPNN